MEDGAIKDMVVSYFQNLYHLDYQLGIYPLTGCFPNLSAEALRKIQAPFT